MGYRYIGAKTKLLDKLIKQITTIVPEGGHICDLMAGTGAVSLALRELGYQVTAVDLMTFSFHHARLALLFCEYPKFNNADAFIRDNIPNFQETLFPQTRYEKVISALNNVPPISGYFWREFCVEGTPKNTTKPRNYFSPTNSRKIDAIRQSIKSLKHEDQISDLEHSLLLHDLIMAVNDIANIAGTYGHYLSKLIGRANSLIKLNISTIPLFSDKGRNIVLKGYAEDLAGTIPCDLCYIDPPYMKRQYAANYHILETLAREDEPEAIGVSGLRPWRDQYSNFCTKTKIRTSFGKIFENMPCNDFLISYSEDGLLTINELSDCFSNYGQVNIETFRYKRFKSNESKLAPELTEYLIHLKISR